MEKLLLIFFFILSVLNVSAQDKSLPVLDTSSEAFFTSENHEKLIFYRANQKKTTNYSGVIFCDTADGYTFIQFDSLRIYFQYPNIAEEYSSFFTSGLLSNKMFYCELNKDCSPIGGFLKYNEKMELIRDHIGLCYGDYILIYNFSEPEYLKINETKRRFKIQIHNYANYSYFFLECENLLAKKGDSVSDFLRNARITIFELGWSEI